MYMVMIALVSMSTVFSTESEAIKNIVEVGNNTESILHLKKLARKKAIEEQQQVHFLEKKILFFSNKLSQNYENIRTRKGFDIIVSNDQYLRDLQSYFSHNHPELYGQLLSSNWLKYNPVFKVYKCRNENILNNVEKTDYWSRKEAIFDNELKWTSLAINTIMECNYSPNDYNEILNKSDTQLERMYERFCDPANVIPEDMLHAVNHYWNEYSYLKDTYFYYRMQCLLPGTKK